MEYLRSALNTLKSTVNAIRDLPPKGFFNLGAVVQQDDYVEAYESCLLTKAECVAHIYEKELVAVLHALASGSIMYLELRATLRDGNLMETALHSRGATLVGVDKFGNKYYEKLNTQYGRHRWVDYADLNNYDASSVPPEWHGWLHYITDRKPEQLEELKPVRYGIEHKPNVSGLGDLHAYHSKGHAKNPQQRDWTRYEPWTSS
ncbi:hypothetical protein L7F22_002538 [Adiantum nelumboides]|nr:hypothetical protein [Adiantum nelumboides]